MFNNKHTPVKIKLFIYKNLLKPICILKSQGHHKRKKIKRTKYSICS